ncbi:hypothetical protein C8Q78DRAFT_990973 [Trametes maxima]|nr:hypothetical protein C8Q78DRAFT_990973 [Trametes maxima]
MAWVPLSLSSTVPSLRELLSAMSSTLTERDAIGHMQHHSPTDPPTQLSSSHPNIVNFAISAGGVLVGLAIIGAFALVLRCRKRRRQRVLDAQIDARIDEKTIARMAASRATSVAKIPTVGRAANQSGPHPMPLLTAGRTSSSSTVVSSTTPLPRARSTCIRASDQRLPCGCPDCLLLRTRPAFLPGSSTTASSSRPGSISSPAQTSSTRFNPISGRVSRASTTTPSASPRTAYATHPRTGNRTPISTPRQSASPRTRPHNDENAHRAAAIRTNPLPSPRTLEWDGAWTPATTGIALPATTRGIGIGIMTATSTGALGAHFPPPASVSFADADSARIRTTSGSGGQTPTTGRPASVYGSPALSLTFSDDAGATSLGCPSPHSVLATPPPQLSLGSLGTLGSLGRTASSGSGFGFSGSFSRSNTGASLATTHAGSSRIVSGNGGTSLAHMQVSPVAGSPDVAFASPQLARPTLTHRSPKAAGKQPGAPPSRGNGETWFTDVDWLADDGPLALAQCDRDPPPSAYGRDVDHAGHAGHAFNVLRYRDTCSSAGTGHTLRIDAAGYLHTLEAMGEKRVGQHTNNSLIEVKSTVRLGMSQSRSREAG